ncbi:MAG: 4-alpha-glucanotransferase [Candidatus Omnitrophica bacterium]|nr:4-alpha-glucanotransferase [Candidatus Omnitrophota bacterium]
MNLSQAGDRYAGLYDAFASSVCGAQWEAIGVRRRAGVNAPLFSLYSASSSGVGEIPDLKLLADWCVKTGNSIIQLLPMNDVGFDFRPYDAQSTFAFEPMFLRADDLQGISPKGFRAQIQALRAAFPCGRGRVDYAIKAAKLELFFAMFRSCEGRFPEAFSQFRDEQSFWLRPYALFKVLKEKFPESGWEGWPDSYRAGTGEALSVFESENSERVLFHQWLQWQLAVQFSDAHQYAQSRGVLMMGDLPFLVSRDSADVWQNQDYFKLDRVSGAPPDAYIAEGQRWGMPPYRWANIRARDYDYVRAKVRYAAKFFDLFRIDHVVGLFRLWTIAGDEPYANAGLHGSFDPEDENLWEEHGRVILSQMIQPSLMLPCAEDLGVVPPCAVDVLHRFAIPGMDVQRWNRRWESGGSFKEPEEYRPCSCAVISTHDMPILAAWWEFEAGTVDEWLFKKKCAEHGLDFESLSSRVFDGRLYGRLRWKSTIRSTADLAAAAERPEQEISGLTGLCRDSFTEKRKFLEYLGWHESGEPALEKIVMLALEKASESFSVFSVQLIHDYLSAGGYLLRDSWNSRINFPGSVGPQNWSFVLPVSLEEMNELAVNAEILSLHRRTGRAAAPQEKNPRAKGRSKRVRS